MIIFPVRLVPFIILTILVVGIFFFGVIFKRCFISILENKCEGVANLTYDRRKINDEEVKMMKKGYVSKGFTNGVNKITFGIFFFISIKFLIETLVSKKK